jgi:hypothetical protein
MQAKYTLENEQASVDNLFAERRQKEAAVKQLEIDYDGLLQQQAQMTNLVKK